MAMNKRSAKEKALQRLENQLKVGDKPERVDGRTTTNRLPLADADRTRISKEIGFISKKLGY